MNLILLFDSDFISPTRVRLTDRRVQHLHDVIAVKKDQHLTVGQMNGLIGTGKVVAVTASAVELEVQLDQSPPASLPLTLIIPMIRPPMFKRLLFHAATLGIKKIIVLNFSRVEKGLWNSSSLRAEQIQEQLVLGLEQCKDTVLPEVVIKNRFKPFVHDELPFLIKGTLPLIAHPGGGHSSPHQVNGPVTLVIGPEGGILDDELEKFQSFGFQAMDLGSRILRVETVLPYLIGRLYA